MSDSDDANSDLHARLADGLGTGVARIDPLDGGEVGQVHKVALADGRTVVAKTGPTPLDVEADMLDFLGDRGLPDDPDPSLLHGDAWANNVIVRDGAVRAFLDPACYFGHAEVELAYVDFTDSFGEQFFETYREEWGIDSGFFEGRCGIYQLHPLLVHLLYFENERYADEIRERLEALDY